MPASEVLGRITIEGLTIAIGVSVGTAQLGSDNNDTGVDSADNGQQFGGQIVIAVCGAVLFAANVAPTEEIIQIAFETTPGKLLGPALASTALCAVVLQFSSFRGTRELFSGAGWKTAVQGIVVTYAIALLVSAALLWFFGRFQGLGWSAVIGTVVVLGSAAALGVSAGRLLLQVGD